MKTTVSWAARRAAWIAAGAAILASTARGDGDEGAAKPAPATAAPIGKPVDLAICLDTSGSMDGLIDAARQKLWSIVNDLALAKPTPKLRVALLTYGNDGHPAEIGWVKVDAGFTEDLDLVSQQLFALTTNGGTEYVGRVLQAATDQLVWSNDPGALKLVVVAGNEAADQDPQVDFRNVCKTLIERGIVVNSIYCGNPADGLAPAWQEVARRADGQFAAIDQQNGTVVIATPFDAELATLSASINETYLAYGAGGAAQWENQARQDANAASCNDAAAAARACTKGGALYRCSWDLVDAVKNGTVKLEEVKKEELPEKMRELAAEEKQKVIDTAWTKRQEIQKKIQEVGQKRAEHLDVEMKKAGTKEDQAFDRAVRDAIRKQAESKGFAFPKDEKKPEAPKDEPKKEQSVPPQVQKVGNESSCRAKVLVVEDDAAIRRGLVDALRFAGFEVRESGDGREGLQTALAADVDLALLDVVLPGIDGFEILASLRRTKPALPVIMVTARGAESDRVRGLSDGADDYVVKPFSARELLARVEAVLRRSASRPAATGRLEWPGGSIDFARREARIADGAGGVAIRQLSEKEQQILQFLAGAADRAVPREELLERVWGLDPRGLETRTVDMHVARLREKIGAEEVIVTVRGRGYMLAPDVRRA